MLKPYPDEIRRMAVLDGIYFAFEVLHFRNSCSFDDFGTTEEKKTAQKF